MKLLSLSQSKRQDARYEQRANEVEEALNFLAAQRVSLDQAMTYYPSAPAQSEMS